MKDEKLNELVNYAFKKAQELKQNGWMTEFALSSFKVSLLEKLDKLKNHDEKETMKEQKSDTP